MEYQQPKGLEEVFLLLERWRGKGKVIAGGTNLLPDLRAGAVKPEAVIDLSRLKNLSYIREEKKRVRIGALVTIAEIASSEVLKEYGPILSRAAGELGNPLVRNRATLAGNLANASPAADMGVPLLALEATITSERSGGRQREIPIDRFFVAPNKTVLKADEIIREISFSKPTSAAKWNYIKMGLRNAMAVSVASLGMLLDLEGERCGKARIGLGAVAPTPVRAYGTEALLRNQAVGRELIEACCRKIETEVSPISDIRASAGYRRSMVSVLLKRSFEEIFCARES